MPTGDAFCACGCGGWLGLCLRPAAAVAPVVFDLGMAASTCQLCTGSIPFTLVGHPVICDACRAKWSRIALPLDATGPGASTRDDHCAGHDATHDTQGAAEQGEAGAADTGEEYGAFENLAFYAWHESRRIVDAGRWLDQRQRQLRGWAARIVWHAGMMSVGLGRQQ